jgi:hypothetical protein
VLGPAPADVDMTWTSRRADQSTTQITTAQPSEYEPA